MRFVLWLLLMVSPGIASAVYKCESGGKVTYSDDACKNGTSIPIDTSEPVIQNRETEKAKQRHLQDKARLKQIETARNKREAAEAKEEARIAKARDAKNRKCRSLAMKRKWLEEDAVAVQGKNAEAARRKAARHAELQALECGGNASMR